MAEQDKAAIVEVMNLYAFALDAHEWDLFDRIFTEDVVMDMGLIGVTWTGRTEFKQGLQNSCAALDAHQHSMTGHLVHVDDDKAHAFCYGNWTLVREAAEGGRTWMGMGSSADVSAGSYRGPAIRASSTRAGILIWTRIRTRCSNRERRVVSSF